MPGLARAVATLRISGDTLNPGEVSGMLGATPTKAQKKGQELRSASGLTRTAKFGMWRLEALETASADFDGQVQEVLGKLTDDIAVWNRLASEYKVDLFCGWFMEMRNEGLEISDSTLLALGVRGIKLSLDIYAGDKENDDLRQIVAPDSDQS
jgi:hypothetical protein